MSEQQGNNQEYNDPRCVDVQSYAGQYPDMAEFQKPWEHCIQVGQGGSGVSHDGRPLESEGFSKCAALLLQDATSIESALLHIDDVDVNDKQREKLKELSGRGQYDAVFIRGTSSRDLKQRIMSSNELPDNIQVRHVLEDIQIDTGKKHWDIVYKPNERRIYLNSRDQNKVFVFQM